ncbi:hypothetical protein NS220_10905 [Microbacterium testaceum]|uniref:HTH araC/xylS-type domain-containing protein n=1 Tax=Microbacterium testaceum TaxID=2033 RepID=A0A147EWA6_MICTE|nr:AraC family transcriptional regulator [Microbacterium testaceum]KTR93911.1 hypothetical protein NS220_10905 [Microbacterium testaceum]
MVRRTAASVSEWEALSSAAFVPLRVTADGAFTAHLDHRGRARAAMSSVRSGACRVLRDPTTTSAPADDLALFSFQYGGRNLVDQNDRQAVVAPGDGVLYLTRSPYELLFPGPSDLIVLQVPTDWLGMPTSALSALSARAMSTRSNAALRTASRLVRSQFGGAPLFEDEGRTLRVATELLVAALRREGRRGAPGLSHDALYASFRRTIAENLDDPLLGVPAIADLHGVSVRTVHQVFAERSERAAALVRTLRTARARTLLRETALPVPDVAVRCGIPDPTVFARTFRREVGQSPTQFRAAQRERSRHS